MWIPSPDSKRFTSKFRYVELMRYFPDLGKPAREKVNGETLVDVSCVGDYAAAHDWLGIYTSIFSSDSRDIDKATGLGPLYFDLDSGDLREAQRDALRLGEYLLDALPESAVKIYFTGLKGFHLECEPVALGIGPSHDLPGLFRYIATQLRDELVLTTIDFAVYDRRRMWRLPNSRHQKSGLFKVEIPFDFLKVATPEGLRQYASVPHELEIIPQEFDPRANEWYREWIYRQEDSKHMSAEEMFERFKKYGSRVQYKDDSELVFDPIRLFEGCHAIMDLWNKAETENDLSHEERLFLCSILTYTDEAIEYLHAILRNCSDYNESKSRSHIQDWIRRRELGIGGRPYSCERANSAGVGCGDCHLEPKERYIQVGGKFLPTGEAAAPSPLRYGYHRKGGMNNGR